MEELVGEKQRTEKNEKKTLSSPSLLPAHQKSRNSEEIKNQNNVQISRY
jgi:hypothetical protein